MYLPIATKADPSRLAGFLMHATIGDDLGFTAIGRVTGPDVIGDFLRLIDEHGPPASTTTNNGVVYTARFVGGKNAFELSSRLLGITQKNGSEHREV